MADKFDEFLEEVESDIRQEKLEKLWKEYGKIIITAVVGALSLSGGYMVWKNHQDQQNKVLSEKFVGAQDLMAEGKMEEAIGVMKSLTSGSHKRYAVLARFSEAALKLKQNPEESQDLYHRLAHDRSVDQDLRDLALIFYLNLRMGRLTPGNEPPEIEECLKSLDPLTDEKNPWYCLALELKGILTFKKNDFATSSEVFLKLAQDPKTPEGMRTRAQLMTQTLASHVVNQPSSSSIK